MSPSGSSTHTVAETAASEGAGATGDAARLTDRVRSERRADWIEAFLSKLVSWEDVARRLELARG